jgi:hypothetical protein
MARPINQKSLDSSRCVNTRRQFLFNCSASLAALVLAPIATAQVSARHAGETELPRPLTYATFCSQINTFFQVPLASGEVVKLKLLKAPLARPTPVVPGRRPPGDAGNEKFSLIFSGPKGAPLASAIHSFAHPRLGGFELYIGQFGSPDMESIRYEAVFNQPASAAIRSRSFNL